MTDHIKPGDEVRVRQLYYPGSLDSSLVHVVKGRYGDSDRFELYCVRFVIWGDVITPANSAATCLLCLAQQTSFEDDLNELNNRIAAAAGLPPEFITGKKP